jgi:two-component system chemotaxis response regulator CheY
LLTEDSTILIVDDQAVMRKAIARVLDKAGLRKHIECGNLTDAILCLDSECIDAVVLDMRLGSSDGLDLVEFTRGRELASDVPILIVTGEAERDDIMRAVDAGANDYLVKPFQSEDLASKIKKLLQAYLNPDGDAVVLRASERLILNSRLTEAIEMLKSVLDTNKQNLRAMLLTAICSFRLGKNEQAIQICDQVITINPQYFKAFRTKADVLIKMNRPDEAIFSLKKELELHPKTASRQALLAKLLLAQKSAQEAKEHFRLALQQNNKHLDALVGMVSVFSQEENFEKSLYYIKRLRRTYPSVTKVLESAIHFAFKYKQERQIELMLREERHQFPKRKEVHQALLAFYARAKLDDKVEESTLRFAKEMPEDATSILAVGDLHMQKKRYGDAIEAFLESLRHSPNPNIYPRLVKAMIAAQRFEEAEEICSTMLRMGMNRADVVSQLANLAYEKGDVRKAYFLLKLAASLGKSSDLSLKLIAELRAKILASRPALEFAS